MRMFSNARMPLTVLMLLANWSYAASDYPPNTPPDPYVDPFTCANYENTVF